MDGLYRGQLDGIAKRAAGVVKTAAEARGRGPARRGQVFELVIRHWEVTARVQKAFLSFFWICLIF